jgi:hypothetical protein
LALPARNRSADWDDRRIAMLSISRDLIAALHAAPARWVLAITGGGAAAAAELLSVPGGSRSVLEIVVPYHEQALADFLGHRPDASCSALASEAMARRALDRARWLAPAEATFGLGCTASLVSDRPKRGDHRVHVSTAGCERLRTWSLILTKGARARTGEESVAAALVLNAMAQTLGVSAAVPLSLLPEEKIDERSETSELYATLPETSNAIFVAADGRVSPETAWDPARPMVLVPGAFNPLHSGHWALAALAERLAAMPAAFELSRANVDKAELSPAEVRSRLRQFAGHAPVWLTRAPRFVDKARLFPGAIFAVGADTAQRLADPRYYEQDDERLRQAFDFFRRQGCRFLVAGRMDASGRFLGLEGLAIPVAFRDLFRAIAREEFLKDVSSTLLRDRCR